MRKNYINKFIEFKKHVRGLSDKTIDRYHATLLRNNKYFKSIWKDLLLPESIELKDIHSFITNESKRGISTRTTNDDLSVIRCYLDWLINIEEYGKEVLNPKKIFLKKFKQEKVWFFSGEQIEKILDCVNRGFWKSRRTQLRNKIAVYMLLYTWLRIGELVELRRSDINWNELQVVGKWWKRRTIYLKPELVDMLNMHMPILYNGSDYIFSNHTTKESKKGERCWAIKSMFWCMSKFLGFHVHAHLFRHTYAVKMFSLPWANIYNVASILGHSKITTTQIYLWVHDHELEKLQYSVEY